MRMKRGEMQTPQVLLTIFALAAPVALQASEAEFRHREPSTRWRCSSSIRLFQVQGRRRWGG